jgi:hypothetical protein
LKLNKKEPFTLESDKQQDQSKELPKTEKKNKNSSQELCLNNFSFQRMENINPT